VHVKGSSRVLQVARLALIAGVALGVGASSAAPAVADQESCVQDRHLVLIDAQTGAIDCTASAPSGPVTASVPDAGGGWFIAGSFTRVDGFARPFVAHLDGRGKVETGFRARVSLSRGLSISALARHGSVLFAGWREGVVALDARTGRQIWKTSVGRTDSSNSGCCAGVNDVAFANGVLYVVGVYKLIGGVARHDVAALDPRTGRPLRWAVDVGRPGKSWIVDRGNDGDVLAVEVADGTVYLGGEFDQLGGAARKNVAAVSARTGRATAWAPSLSGGGSIDAMVVAYGELIVGGHAALSAFDIRTARPYTWTAGVFGSVAEFAASGGIVYLGGDPVSSFKMVGNRAANNLAAVGRLPGGRFTGWRPSINTEVDVQALAVSGNTVLAGGGFCSTPGGC
jgi:outer membrane protein assembly factor BamB